MSPTAIGLRDETLRVRVAALDSISQGVLIAEMDQTIVYANDAFLRLSGYERNEVVGQNCRMLQGPLTDAKTVADMRAAIDAAIEFRGEVLNYRKDGSVFWNELSISPMRGDAGTIKHFIGSLLDVTERVQREQRLQLLETAVERLNDIVLITEAEPVGEPGPRIVWVNDAFERRTGWRREEVIGKTPRILQGPATQRSELDRIRKALQAWQPVRSELINYTRQGQPFWLELDIVPIANERGWFTHWVAVERDVTERQIAQGALRDSENTQRLLAIQLDKEKAKLVAAQSVARIGSWETDLATLEVTWSAQTHRIFETDAASFRPTHAAFLQLVHPHDRESVEKAFAQSLESTGSYAVEHRVQLPNGRIKFVQERWQTFTDGALKPVRAIGVSHDITERKQAEEAHARLSHILESSLNEIYVFDAESLRFEYVSPGALRNLGYPLEAMVGMTPLDLKPQYTEADFRQVIAPLVRGDQAQQRFETMHRRADGSLYPVEVHLQLVEDQNKRVFLGCILDITERKRAELARDASEDRFRLLWQTCSNAVVLMDRNSIIRYANPALLQVFGHEPADAIGKGLALLQPHRMAAGHERGVRRYLETGQRSLDWRAVETIGLHKDGHEFPIEITFSSMEIDGAPMFAGFMRDVTERKLAEQTARESAERFRLLSKASRDAIWDWDLQADTLWWNEGYQELFGLQHHPTNTVAQQWEASIHPQDRERVMAGIREAMAGSANVWSDSYRALRGDGSQAQVDGRGYLIRDGAGLAIRMVGALTDVSAKVLLEEQLRQSQRLESVGQLTGGIAHDFNNLLTVILGNAELLQEELIRDKAHHDLADMIVGAAQRGADLTQRLLAFARKQPLDSQPLDLNRLIDNFDPLLRRTLGEQVEIASVRGAGLWHALADARQLESGLLNLCINSRDAMPDGGRLTIETANIRLDEDYTSQYAEVQPGDYVMLAVSDTGQGMEPQVIARVFEPFFTTKETGKGTGLGLAMVYGFVKQSNGHIDVYSEPGHGTTVRVYLPRAIQSADTGIQASGQPHLRGGGETILLVEDDELVQGYARGQLAALGYQVIEAPDGLRALDIVRSNATIDLLFTDVVMPGMGGRQLVEQAQLLRPGLKVIYTSGYTENAIAYNGQLDPGVYLLSKPYRRSVLASKVREALDS